MTDLIKLDNVSDLEKFSERIAKSGLAPKSFDTPEKVLVALVYGRELGFSPMQSLQSLIVINGKVSISGDGAKALCEPFAEFIKDEVIGESKTDSRGIRVTVKRANKPPLVRDFTVGDAKRAGLWGKAGPWLTYPERMCYYRAIGFALRDAFPDVLRGIKTEEELRDYPQEERPAPPVKTVLDSAVSGQLKEAPVEEENPVAAGATNDELINEEIAALSRNERISEVDELSELPPVRRRGRPRKTDPAVAGPKQQEPEEAEQPVLAKATHADKVEALRKRLANCNKSEEALLDMLRIYETDAESLESLGEELLDRIELHWAGILPRL
jgi:hypothetical protein